MDNCSNYKESDPLLSPTAGKEADFHRRSLVIGYGNIDRQDDGIAWHVLRQVASSVGCGNIDPFETPQIDCTPNLTLYFALQLTPEMTDLLKDYDRVCFVDAYTGSDTDPVHVENIKAEYIRSPLTHHLTPSACLALVEILYGQSPEGLLVSIKGYEFGFSQEISSNTASHTKDALNQILNWTYCG